MQMERYRMNYCQNWWKVPESKVRKHRTELNDRASHSRYFSDELDELDAQFFVKKRTYVYRIRYLWYNLFIAQNKT